MVDRIGGTRPFRHYIAEWIEAKNLDQKRVADRMECEPGTLSKLISGKMRLTDVWMTRIATALDIPVADLFRDPAQPSADDLLRSATPEQRRQALTVLEALLKKAS